MLTRSSERIFNPMRYTNLHINYMYSFVWSEVAIFWRHSTREVTQALRVMWKISLRFEHFFWDLNILLRFENFIEIWKFHWDLKTSLRFEYFIEIWIFYSDLNILLRFENFIEIWIFHWDLNILLRFEYLIEI